MYAKIVCIFACMCVRVCVRETDREGGKRGRGVCMCMCVHTCFPKDRIRCFLQILKNFLILKMLRISDKLIKDYRIVLMCSNHYISRDLKYKDDEFLTNIYLIAKEINGSKPLPSRSSHST